VVTTRLQGSNRRRAGQKESVASDHERSTPDPTDLAERRVFEESALAGSVVQTIMALMQDAGVSQRELAERVGWSQPRISQILNSENLNLSTAADLAWALGYRFELVAAPAQRKGTPATDDPDPPSWVRREARALLRRI